uniref:Uncharacterized protein n=1 Tax=uncultured bacterium pES01019D12 TaxID=355333 RepID=A0EJL4_9BACT|nr:hypothetical protein [uncultured bacterium pES01019D12]
MATPLVKNMQQLITVPTATDTGIADLHTRFPTVQDIGLRSVLGKTFYAVSTLENRYLVDPVTGDVVSPLGEQSAREIAEFHFNGDGPVIAATLISSDPPREIGSRRLPLWRIDFDDRYSTTFYIDPDNGRLVTRRHQYWRIFDFLWMLHIMDYVNRDDVHNLLLKTAQITGLTFVLTGFWLLYFRLKPRRKQRRAR